MGIEFARCRRFAQRDALLDRAREPLRGNIDQLGHALRGDCAGATVLLREVENVADGPTAQAVQGFDDLANGLGCLCVADIWALVDWKTNSDAA